jgi:hypothetical protein
MRISRADEVIVNAVAALEYAKSLLVGQLG